MNNRKIGSDYEEKAKQFLEGKGVVCLEQNYRIRSGEIDLIGRDGKYLVFFEIKSRKNSKCGMAEYAVGYSKQKVICKTADYYRVVHKIPSSTAVRYDVIAFNGTDIHWIKNAFNHIY